MEGTVNAVTQLTGVEEGLSTVLVVELYIILLYNLSVTNQSSAILKCKCWMCKRWICKYWKLSVNKRDKKTGVTHVLLLVLGSENILCYVRWGAGGCCGGSYVKKSYLWIFILPASGEG